MVEGDLAPELSDAELEQCYEQTRAKYEDRVKNVLRSIKTELESFSWFCSKIYAREDGEFVIAVSRDALHLTRDGEPDDLDVEIIIQILKSKEWDGTRGGTAFKTSVMSYGGNLVGGFLPFNFSDDVWVPVIDDVKVEGRMVLLEQVEPFTMVTLLRKWTKGKVAR